MAEVTTKERILDAAEGIMLEKSFHSVGLNEILKAVGVPKGSFYHHFESKEQFGAEMLKHYVAEVSAFKRRALLSTEPESNPRKRILTYLESMVGKFIENGGKCPCLVLKVASEVVDSSEPMRMALAEGQKEWDSILSKVISEGINKHKISKEIDPIKTARLIGHLWTGAMHRAVVDRDAGSLRESLAFIASQLLLSP